MGWIEIGNFRVVNDELEESIEFRTGRSSPQPSLVLHALARPQARPCRLLLLVVSFSIYLHLYVNVFSVLYLVVFCRSFYLWVFGFYWIRLWIMLVFQR